MIGVVVRRCRRPDLPLEWDGEFTPARAVFAQLFALARRGAIVVLVAGRVREHLGQIWIDLARTRAIGCHARRVVGRLNRALRPPEA